MASSKTTLQQHFPSNFCHKIYWYDAISTINPLKQLNMRILNFLKNASISSHSLTTTFDLPPKLLSLWLPFFPSTKFISVHVNLSYFRDIYFCLGYVVDMHKHNVKRARAICILICLILYVGFSTL